MTKTKDDKPSEEDQSKPSGDDNQNVNELPQWARDALTKANSEAAGYRTKVRELEPLAEKGKQAEEADKTAGEKLTDAERKAQEAENELERLKLIIAVAETKGLTHGQAKRLVGSTKEELEADADELLKTFGGDEGGDGEGKKPPDDKPQERLKGGGDPTREPDPDVDDIVNKVRRN